MAFRKFRSTVILTGNKQWHKCAWIINLIKRRSSGLVSEMNWSVVDLAKMVGRAVLRAGGM